MVKIDGTGSPFSASRQLNDRSGVNPKGELAFDPFTKKEKFIRLIQNVLKTGRARPPGWVGTLGIGIVMQLALLTTSSAEIKNFSLPLDARSLQFANNAILKAENLSSGNFPSVDEIGEHWSPEQKGMFVNGAAELLEQWQDKFSAADPQQANDVFLQSMQVLLGLVEMSDVINASEYPDQLEEELGQYFTNNPTIAVIFHEAARYASPEAIAAAKRALIHGKGSGGGSIAVAILRGNGSDMGGSPPPTDRELSASGEEPQGRAQYVRTLGNMGDTKYGEGIYQDIETEEELMEFADLLEEEAKDPDGEYILLSAEGFFKQVYLHKFTGQVVAVGRYNLSEVMYAKAANAVGLENPGIDWPSSVFIPDDANPNTGMGIIVMELARGKAVSDLIQDGGISPQLIQKFIVNFATDLGKLHGLTRIAHNDLNSGNVLADQSTGDITILDYGMSKRLTSENAEQAIRWDFFMGWTNIILPSLPPNADLSKAFQEYKETYLNAFRKHKSNTLPQRLQHAESGVRQAEQDIMRDMPQ